MIAIILAAGKGIRLRPLTERIPKCLLEINGTTILENCLKNLRAVKVDKVIIVVGHCKEKIIEKIGDSYEGMPIEYIFAPDYETTNNIVSLWYGIQNVDDDIFLIESDVFFGSKLLPDLKGNEIVVSWYLPNMKGTVVSGVVYAQEMILGSKPDLEGAFKTVNIYRIQKDTLKKIVIWLDVYIKLGYTQEYYEVVIAELIKKKERFWLHFIAEEWAEVDDIEDLKRARYKFSDNKYETISELHGYYWSYDVVDHCHLYNMYFPPKDMIDYFKVNIEKLVGTYPSGRNEITYFLSEWLGIDPKYLVVGNGASELIKVIGSDAKGFCVSTPSFNEFEKVTYTVKVPLDEETWEFNKEEFLKALNEGDVDYGVIVTPNNPTSIAVNPEDIVWVLQRTEKKVIVDESFIDFSHYPSLLDYSHLISYPNLIILKSMSKVFGICGLRLGFVASINPIIKDIRGKLPIWNINSFAECFVRQISKYEKQFKESCEKTKHDRDMLYKELKKNERLKIWKPDANFILCKAWEGVTERLFEKNILVKDCGEKTMKDGEKYIRISSRKPYENMMLCRALRDQ